MPLERRDFDAIVVGSGPNGLAATILMQQKGLSVLLIEGKETIGGGMRSAELTLPGFTHDICSAVHPLAVLSPFFRGCRWISLACSLFTRRLLLRILLITDWRQSSNLPS